jgi:adenylate cyclase
LELLRELPESPQHDLDELKFCLALGIPMVLTKGHSTPEVEGIYNRAREICRQLGEDPQHFQALLGLRRYYLHRGALVKARQLSEQLIELSYQMDDDIYISRAHMMQLEMLYRQGEFTQIHKHYQGGMAHFQPDHSPTHIFLFGNDTGVGCRIFETLALWYLGFPEKALKGAVNFLEIARQLSHPFTLVFCLYFISNLFQLCRDVESAQRVASELLKIAQERGFSMYVAWGTVLQGWVLVENNQTEAGIHNMEQGIGDWRDMGASLLLPNFYLNLAEAYQRAGRTEAGLNALEDALAVIDETGERTFEPEIYRIKGELLRLNNIEGAEACFQKAIQKARNLDAKAWELRAVTSLYRFHLEGNRLALAGDALQEIYDSYQEGFDLPDLADARNLLNAGQLNCQTHSH